MIGPPCKITFHRTFFFSPQYNVLEGHNTILQHCVQVMKHYIALHMCSWLWAYLGDISGSVPGHRNKVNIIIESYMFCFFSIYKNYVYAVL